MRILQISDLHIVAGRGEHIYGVDSFASLERVLASGLEERPDCIVATGDLTERGDAESYRRLRKLLLATELPVFVVPGNHDSLRRIADELCGDRIAFQKLHDAGGWRLLFVDSRVRGQAHGAISPEQSEQLERSIAQAETRPVLIALHHSPIAGCPSLGCQLRGAGEWLERLAPHGGVRLILAGHAHQAASARFERLQIMTAPSTCAEALHDTSPHCKDLGDFWASHRFDPTRHGYRLLDLEPDGQFSSEVRWLAGSAAA